jgi:hypothetical protein
MSLQSYRQNQIPVQLKNQLNDIVLKRHLGFNSNNNNNNKQQRILSNDASKLNKRKRSLSQDRQNIPVPLMQLNIVGVNNIPAFNNNNNNKNKTVCPAKQQDYTQDLQVSNLFQSDFNNDPETNGFNSLWQSFDNQ